MSFAFVSVLALLATVSASPIGTIPASSVLDEYTATAEASSVDNGYTATVEASSVYDGPTATMEASSVYNRITATVWASSVYDGPTATVIASGVDASGYPGCSHTGYAVVPASIETAPAKYRFTLGGNIV